MEMNVGKQRATILRNKLRKKVGKQSATILRNKLEEKEGKQSANKGEKPDRRVVDG
jgi:hypothetical protein